MSEKNGLLYLGPEPSESSTGLAVLGQAQATASLAMSEQDVDNYIEGRFAGSFIPHSSAGDLDGFATKQDVDDALSLMALKSEIDKPGGPVSLDDDGLISSDLLPKGKTSIWRTNYHPTSYTSQTVLGGAAFKPICTVNIPAPGFSYRALPFGVFESHRDGHFALPTVVVTTGGDRGTTVGEGYGTRDGDLHRMIYVTPKGSSLFSNATRSFTFWAYAQRDGGQATINSWQARAVIHIHRG